MKHKDLGNCINKAHFFVLDSNGNEVEIDLEKIEKDECGFDNGLNNLIRAMVGSEKTVHFANHTKLMQKFEWLDYEPSSDKGHFRFYPKGALVYQLLVKWCDELARENFEASPLKTPFIYKSSIPAIKEQIGVFKDSVYPVFGQKGDESFVLRFNDDLGLFEIMKNSKMSHKHLPFRVYEHTPSFRYNQSGALSGIRRGRFFSFTDIHSFCRNTKDGFTEYLNIQKKLSEIAKIMKVNLTIHFKVTREYYHEVKKIMVTMLSANEKMLVELIPSQRQYWSMKHIACTEHPQKLFHVQFDLENSNRFDIKYVDSDGDKKECVIIHTSLGSIEKWMIIIIEEALKKEYPVLPLWLCPTQVRIIPISNDKHFENSLEIARKFKQKKIRVDIDNRRYSVGKKIRHANEDWIPYVIVFGDKEKSGDNIPIRTRDGNIIDIEIEKFIEGIKKETAGMPFMPLAGTLLSKKPTFRG